MVMWRGISIQISELGKVLDPLADKLLLVSAIVTLSLNHGTYLGQIPLWLTGTVIGRDLLILIGMGVIHYMVGDVVVHPRYAGKIATVLQMVLVMLILFKWDFEAGDSGCGLWPWARPFLPGFRVALYVGRSEAIGFPSVQFADQCEGPKTP